VAERVTLETQLACIRREIRMRENVYPRWIETGKMTANKANAELAAMRAVLETLVELQATTRLL